MIRRLWPALVLLLATGCPDTTSTVSVTKKATKAASPSPAATATIAASQAPALTEASSPSPSPSVEATATPTPEAPSPTPTASPSASPSPTWSTVLTATGLGATAVAGDDTLWALAPADRTLRRYDAGGALIGSYALPAASNVANATLAVDPGNAAWILLPADRALVRCTPAGAVTGPFALPYDGANVPFGPACDAAGTAWVGSGAGTSTLCYQLLPDGSLRATYDMGVAIDELHAVPGGGLWIAASAPRQYLRRDPDGQPLASYVAGDEGKPVGVDAAGNLVVQAGGTPVLAKIGPAGTLLGRSDVPARDQVLLADGTTWVLADERIAHLDATLATIATLPIATGARALGIDNGGAPWVAWGAGGVARLGSDGTIAASYPAGAGPRAIGFTAGGRVRVAADDGSLTFGMP